MLLGMSPELILLAEPFKVSLEVDALRGKTSDKR